MRPRGIPPTPSAASSAREPVGMTEISVIWLSPRRMMAPLPYCFSIWPRASPRARCFSSFLLCTVCCAILSPTTPVCDQWLITDRSLIARVALPPPPHPAWGGRAFFLFWRVYCSSRVLLQDHLPPL